LLTKKEKRGFPSLWLSAENQRIDFPYFFNGGALYFCDAGRFVISLTPPAGGVII